VGCRGDAVEVRERARRVEPVHQIAEVVVEARLRHGEALQLAAQCVRIVAEHRVTSAAAGPDEAMSSMGVSMDLANTNALTLPDGDSENHTHRHQ
jgi:hypothetical protein